MFRNDSHNSHGVRPDGKRPCHMENNCCIIQSLCMIQHGKIIDGTGFFHCIISKCHISGCQRFSIGKLYIIPDMNSPEQSVLIDRIICSQIIIDGQIRICDRQRALDQRFMHMLSRSPAKSRIKSGFRLRVGIHGNHNGRTIL